MNWANVLTTLRIILIIPVTLAAYYNFTWIVFWLFILIMATDFFDGKVARWRGTASKQGAIYDSAADTLLIPFYLSWIWMLFPEIVEKYWMHAVAIVILTIITLITNRWKLGTYTGLHLWSGKLGAAVGLILVPLFIITGPLHWYVWLTLVVAYISFIEEIAYVLMGKKDLDGKSIFFN